MSNLSPKELSTLTDQVRTALLTGEVPPNNRIVSLITLEITNSVTTQYIPNFLENCFGLLEKLYSMGVCTNQSIKSVVESGKYTQMHKNTQCNFFRFLNGEEVEEHLFNQFANDVVCVDLIEAIYEDLYKK